MSRVLLVRFPDFGALSCLAAKTAMEDRGVVVGVGKCLLAIAVYSPEALVEAMTFGSRVVTRSIPASLRSQIRKVWKWRAQAQVHRKLLSAKNTASAMGRLVW
eukprot:2206080-Lingulodinium_polyedra.AAC.1